MGFWNDSINIGTVQIPRFIGGPMDGFTDSPFRSIVRLFSPHELLYSELTHTASVAHAADKTNSLRFEQIERPLNFQFAANGVDAIDLACAYVVLTGVDMVDLNIGCPARNVVGSGSGSALMADIPRLKKIIRRLRKNLPIPFTVKMRAGFKEHNALDVARLAQDEGVDALIIHPRLQGQKFSGMPDYTLVSQIKKQVSVPVIISGGVVDIDSAVSIHEQTGVDGFMVSRALCGAPWKLKELQLMAEGRLFSISSSEMCDIVLNHFEAMLDYYGPDGLYMFRKHLACYIKDGPDASEFRHRLIRENSVEVVKEGVKTFFRIRSERHS